VSRRQGWLALSVLLAGASGLLVWLGRDYTFVADEVAWIEWVGTEPLPSLLGPYNGNLHVSTLLVTRGLLSASGTGYLPFSLFGAVGLCLSGAVLYSWCARRLGYALALVPVALIAGFGSGWAILLQPLVGTVFYFGLGLGLLALLMLERRDRTGDLAACALLCASLSFYSLGVAFLAAGLVALAFTPEWRRRLWVILVPAVLYGSWRIASGFIDSPAYLPQFGGEAINLIRAPLSLIDSAALVVQAIFTGGTEPITQGPATSLVLDGFTMKRLAATAVLALVEAGALAVAFIAMRRRGGIPPSVWAALAALVTLWSAQAFVLGEGRTPNESRYLFSGAFLVVVLAVEVVGALRPSRRVLAIAAAAMVIPIALNLREMDEPNRLLEDYSIRARADMAVVELASNRVDPGFVPQLLRPVVPYALYLTAGPWNEMVHRHGSPSLPLSELPLQSDDIRMEADIVLAAALRLQTSPVGAPGRGCRPSRGGPLRLPASGAVLLSARPALVFVGRWAAGHPAFVGDLKAGQARVLRVPRDEVQVPWRVTTQPPGQLEVCALGAGRARVEAS